MAVHYDAEKGCHVIKFVMYIDGKRVRKTKRLPSYVGLETALAYEQRMMTAHEPHRDLKDRLLALPDDPKGQGWVYAVRAVSGAGPVKIGMTRRNVNQRIFNFNVTATDPWVEIASVKVKCPQAVEGVIHATLHEKRIVSNRELFNVDLETILDLFGAVADTIEHINPVYEVGFRSNFCAREEAA